MYTITELVEGYRSKKFSPVEMTKRYLERSHENELNAYITITDNIALTQATKAEERWQSGTAGLLEGVPISYKDNIFTKDVVTTSGSKIDSNFIPTEDAPVVKTLQQEGAIMIGKANMHEFAFGITNNNPFYGPAKNPWNPKMISGGSSGGSAVSVAANLCVASIGTDTGGSVRIPAASCGLVGLKPTKSVISGKGTTPISWTLDHIGPTAHTTTDITLIMEALTNKPFSDTAYSDLRDIKIGIPTNFFHVKIEEEVFNVYKETLEKFKDLGAELIEVEVPGAEEAMSLTFTLAIAEAGFVHKERMKNGLEQYGDDVRKVMEASKSIPAQEYIHALIRREELSRLFEKTFRNINVLMTPTLPAQPKPIDQEEVIINGQTEPIFDCMNRFTNYFNVTGHPALTIPVGISDQALPIGIQLASAMYNESLLLKIASSYEQQYLKEFYIKKENIIGGYVKN